MNVAVSRAQAPAPVMLLKHGTRLIEVHSYRLGAHMIGAEVEATVPYRSPVTVVLLDAAPDGHLTIDGTVVWSHGDRMNIQLDRPRAREVHLLQQLIARIGRPDASGVVRTTRRD